MKLPESVEVDLRVGEILKPNALRSNRLFRKILPIDESKKAHSELIANIQFAIGKVELQNRKSDKAPDVLRKAKDILEATGGDTSEVLISIGDACLDLKDYKTAERELEMALRTRTESYGLDSVEVASVLDSFGMLYLEKESAKEALEYVEQGLATKQAHYHYLHPEVALTLSLKGKVLLSLKRFEQSRRSLEQALKIYEVTFDSGHPGITAIWCNLGKALEKADIQRANFYWKKALNSFEVNFGQDDKRSRYVRGLLAGRSDGNSAGQRVF